MSVAFKTQTPNAEMITINPTMAAEMMRGNSHNRSIRPFHVAAMARDMRLGRWQQNGDPIRFYTDGTLADGQHRLSAIIRSGLPQTFFVVRNLPIEAMQTIDGGMKRTHGDRLALTGAKNAKLISAALSVMAILAQRKTSAKLTAPEMFSAYAMHPDVGMAAAQVKGIGLGLESMMTAFLYIGHAVGDGEAADSFAHVMKTGIAGHEKCAAFVAREKIIKSKSGIARMHRDGLLSILCAGWDAHRQGREVKRLHPMRFAGRPEVHGWGPENMPRQEAEQ